MKQFFTILKFELDNYFKSKSYVISTILIAVLAAGIMFVPRVKDAITGDKKDSTVQEGTSKENSVPSERPIQFFCINLTR